MFNYEIKINENGAYKIAKSLCENYHYSKCVPSSRYYFTIYEENELVGVITYGNGANPYGAYQFGMNQGEALELTRCAFKTHKNFLSLYIAKCHKYLKSKNIKLIYSYSDLRQNHLGTLYKSANFSFVAERKLSGMEIWNETKQRWEHQRNYWKKYKSMKQDNESLTWKQFIEINQYKTREQSNKLLWIRVL